MNWWGSGLITVILYANNMGNPFNDSKAILAEDGSNLLTQSGQDIDTES